MVDQDMVNYNDRVLLVVSFITYHFAQDLDLSSSLLLLLSFLPSEIRKDITVHEELGAAEEESNTEKDILVEEYPSHAQEIDEEMQANGGVLVDAGVAYYRFVSLFRKDSLMLFGSLIDCCLIDWDCVSLTGVTLAITQTTRQAWEPMLFLYDSCLLAASWILS